MKKISYFMSAVVALAMGFSSCSSDNDIVAGGSETAVVEGIPTTVRVSLKFPTSTSATRAEASNTEVQESTVKDALVIIVNASGKVENVVSLDASKKAENVETTTGNKFFYALVNGPKAESSTDPLFPVKKGDDFNTTLLDKLFDNNYGLTLLTSTENGFVMTNTDEAKATAIVEQAEGAKQTVNINVGRAVSKVNFSANTPALDEKALGTIKDIRYQVLNNNAKTYVFPRRDAAKHLVTANYGKTLRTGLDYISLIDEATSKAYPYTAAGTTKYLPENSTLNTVTGNVSYVMIRGQFVPNTKYVFDENGKSAVYTDKSDFYVLKNAESQDVLPFIFTAEPAAGAKEAVVKYFNATYNETVDYETLVKEVAAEAGGKGYNVYKYEAGKTYYAIPLLNEKDYDKTTNAVGVYTVKRNSLYELAVNSVSKLGSNNSSWKVGDEVIVTDPEDGIGTDPTQPQDKPEEPTTPLDKPLSIDVSVDVSNWEVIEQGIDL